MGKTPFQGGVEKSVSPRAALARYTLFQVPGTVLLLAALFLLRSWLGLPAWLTTTVVAVWILKDVALFPLVWRSYLPGETGAYHSMVGLVGTAREDLSPAGLITVRGELWRAALANEQAEVKAGGKVRVLEDSGLTLAVEAVPPTSPSRQEQSG